MKKYYNSTIINLECIIKNDMFFNIPIYQRLYVWKELQIRKLLEDLLDACIKQEKCYFLGSVVTVNTNQYYDLIDGQQRFTTLWLICNVMSAIDSCSFQGVANFCCKNDKIRINFSIRKKISEYLKNLLKDNNEIDESIEKIQDISNIKSAIGYIKSFCDELQPDELPKFAEFILKNVILVHIQIPKEADLNKLFELINGRGQQLSQTDILKSKILNIVREQVKSESLLIRYGEIWDACSDMNGYIENNIYHEGKGLSWKELLIYETGQLNEEGVDAEFGDDFLERYLGRPTSGADDSKPHSLLTIISENEVNTPQGKETGNINVKRQIRSIVTFQMLLLYTLRIYLLRNSICLYTNYDRCDISFFNEKKLLQIFSPFVEYLENGHKEQSVDFLHLLWNIRVLFDRNVIKWVKEDTTEDEVLTLRKLKVRKNKEGQLRVSRDIVDAITPMTQLQSMLYFSQPRIYEHWLTPFLFASMDEIDFDNLHKYLMQLDNYLLCKPYKDKQDMMYRTYIAMKDGIKGLIPNTCYKCYKKKISGDAGRSFPHYLFYKLEYMLWMNDELRQKYNWESYRFVSKNSVEHIHPETPRHGEKQIKMHNKFGNLALVSREANSSYGNKSYKEKQALFHDKKNKGKNLDSFKSDIIYSSNVEEWDDEQCHKHFKYMLKIARGYFNASCQAYNSVAEESNQIDKS